MMRFLSMLGNDIRYQFKYGFYFLYAFFSIIYILVLNLCPTEHRSMVASIIVLTDPAMLGAFFIGGIWLLEKSEGLHSYWGISPIRPIEYILSKAVSLAMISTISADLIVILGLHAAVNYFALSLGIFAGAMIFTIIGLIAASYARSVNQYMLLVSPILVMITLPPILAAFGITHPALGISPAAALWYMIGYSIGIADRPEIWMYLVLALWFGLVLLLSKGRIPIAMQMEGRDKV
jgi:fluoroquinolone transport system permease protein